LPEALLIINQHFLIQFWFLSGVCVLAVFLMVVDVVGFWFGVCCLLEEDWVFLHFSEGLFWVAFVERALERFLRASVYVLVRLPKKRRQGCFSYC